MDIDDSPATGAPTQPSADDNELLTMFSCMGTEEKDNLVQQFQYIGNEPSQATAKFFLDMNNWNLQTAIGCYMDYLATARAPQMKVLQSCTVGEGESVTPNTSFTVSWLVQNNGETEWPAGTCLREVSVQALDHMSIQVPALAPLDSTKITVQLVSPAELGEFCTKWRLMTPSNLFFGATITCVVQVCESGTLALTQQLSELRVPNNIPTTVIEHTTNAGGNSGASNNEWESRMLTQSAAGSIGNSSSDQPPPYYATHNVIQQQGQQQSAATDEEMWDDVL